MVFDMYGDSLFSATSLLLGVCLFRWFRMRLDVIWLSLPRVFLIYYTTTGEMPYRIH